MVVRKIIEIDEEKCTGCGACIPNCPEGAIQIIDEKARLVSDLFCDGLGACLGHCPEDAITIIEREAEPYSERMVMGQMVAQGPNVVKAHLEHLGEHGEDDLLREALDYLEETGEENPLAEECKEGPTHAAPHACPGARMRVLKEKIEGLESPATRQSSELRHWPVQLALVPTRAPFFDGADLLIAADCVPFALANFHQDYLRGRSLVVGCPKLDDIKLYKDKLAEIFRSNDIERITVLHMEVPCCFGLHHVVKEAIGDSGKEINLEVVVITIEGKEK